MQISPPCSRLWIGKVGEDADARPDSVLIVGSLCCLTIEIPLATLKVNCVLLVNLHAGIYDVYHVEAHLCHLGEKARRIRETLAIPGKYPIAVECVDIEIESIAGDIALAKGACDLPDFIRRLIAESALSIAQRPQRRQRRMPCQICVASQDILWCWTTKDVVDEIPVCCAEPGALKVVVSQVELDACGAIEKEAPGPAVSQDQRERDRDVEIILQSCMATWWIDIPEELARPRFIQLARAFAATEIALSRRVTLIDTHRRSQRARRVGQIDGGGGFGRRKPAHTKLRVICGKNAPGGIAELDAQGIKSEMSACGGGCDSYFTGFLLNCYWPCLPFLRDDRHRMIANRAFMRKKTDAKQIRSKRCHFDSCRASTYANVGGSLFNKRCCPESLISIGGRRE